MFKVKITAGGRETTLCAPPHTRLSDLFTNGNISVEHPCAGRGVCKKCLVKVDGRDVLSCRYFIDSDITVQIPEEKAPHAASIMGSELPLSESFIALDVGTTTVAAALCSEDGGIIKAVTFSNPQRQYGADVISRIAHCAEHGPDKLHRALIEKVNSCVTELLHSAGMTRTKKLYVSGNTCMLHIFLNIDPADLGKYPYTPAFLEKSAFDPASIGLSWADKGETLPCISSFVGADVTAGMIYCGMPKKGKYNLLADLGTNAELALYNEKACFCTSSAAGPCFEGASISCGMPATEGAISSFDSDGSYGVIGGTEPEGICATGLIDLIAFLLKRKITDPSGSLPAPFYVTDELRLLQEDVRQYQLAKSAVYSGISVLMEKAGIKEDDIDDFFVAGGFSSEMNIDNAVLTGLFPPGLKDKFVPVNNSSLAGTVMYASGRADTAFIDNAKSIDLSSEANFSDLFLKNLDF